MKPVNILISCALIGFFMISPIRSMEKQNSQSMELPSNARSRIYYPLSMLISPPPLNVIRDEIKKLQEKINEQLQSGKLSIEHRFVWNDITIEINMYYEQEYAKKYMNSKEYLSALEDFLANSVGEVRRLEIHSSSTTTDPHIGVWYKQGKSDYDYLFHVGMMIPKDYVCHFEGDAKANVWNSALHKTVPIIQCKLDPKMLTLRNLQDKALDSVIDAYRKGQITLEQLNKRLNPTLRNELPWDIKDELDKKYPPKV